MMDATNNRTPHMWLFLLVITVAGFLSYERNFFATASDWWFEIHASEPTQIVLDGLLYAQETGIAVPGRYLRSSNGSPSDNPRALYTAHDRRGEFKRYDSQYGLQVKFFAAIAALGLDGVEQFQSVASALMAMTVALVTALVARDFSWRAAVAVALIFILSPWVVIFARNLFWVPFTWFLPLAVAMYYSIRVYQNRTARMRMLALLYVTILLKLLCGYEFLTSVILAACCPLLYQGVRAKIPYKRIAGLLFIVGCTAIAAFVTAAFLHISTIAETPKAGFEKFLFRAERRFYSEDPKLTAKEDCQGNKECETVMLASLMASPIDVVKIYLVMPEFLPWLSTTRFDETHRHAFRDEINASPGLIAKFRTIFAHPPVYWFFLLSKILNPLGFVAFIFSTFAVALRTGRAMQGLWAFSFLAPVSWFLAAKGFCYIHDHLCFVAWYLPFILYGTILLCNKRTPNV